MSGSCSPGAPGELRGQRCPNLQGDDSRVSPFGYTTNPCRARYPVRPAHADLAARSAAARERLDAWVREVVDWHFDPATGCPFWLDYAAKLGWDPRREIHGFDDLKRFPGISGRMAARRSRPAMDSEGARRQAGLRVRDRRHDRHAEDARRPRGFPDRLRDFQRDAARRAFPARLQLADARAVGAAAAAPLGRAPGAVPRRRHLLLRRSRSPLGHQADQEGVDRAPAGLQGSRHRSGGHDSPGGPRHPLHVRDAEAARIAGAAARVDGHDDSARRASPESFRAAPSSRRSGTASRTRNCSTAPT